MVRTVPLVVMMVACGTRPRAPVDEAAAFVALLGELAREPLLAETDTFLLKHGAVAPWADHAALGNPARWDLFRLRLPGLRRDTYDHFWSRPPTVPAFDRAGRARVAPAVDPGVAVLFTKGDAEDWRMFHAKWPRATPVALSAMGFSRSGRQGLVYLFFPSWYGAYFLIENENGRWRIAAEWEIWVS